MFGQVGANTSGMEGVSDLSIQERVGRSTKAVVRPQPGLSDEPKPLRALAARPLPELRDLPVPSRGRD
jgi:hypothetical protein